MGLVSGTRLGPYEVIALLGEGGMGEVYRARDLKLNRDVAIKVLPASVAADGERLTRFQREAQVLAALNHPNIAHVHGLEESSTTTALVMELVDGDTLSDRLRRGALPITEALNIARQIATGLEAAHASNVVHRDLKPANIKVRPDGLVKILDFDLAKALTPLPTGDNVSQAATMTSPAMLTNAGVILGTAAYMSPEQARGWPVSTRTDIWAFGCVLYEMLTGRSAFGGPSVPEALARVLEREPDWSALPNATPAKVRQLLGRCLQKDPAKRPRDIAEARRDIEQLIARPALSQLTVGVLKIVAAVLVLMVVAAGLVTYVSLRPARPQTTDRSTWVQLTNLDSATQPALSPDGKMLAFVRGPGTFATSGQVYVKLLPNGEPTPLTQDAFQKMSPVFSPDGARIAYTVNGTGMTWDTWVVPALRGEARPWLRNASGLTWSGPHQILFSAVHPSNHMGLVTSTESQTDARELYFPRLPSAGMVHRSYRSPDGKWVLAVEMNDQSQWIPCRLLPFDGSSSGHAAGPQASRCTNAAWGPDGKTMYFSADTGDGFHLWRQPFPGGKPEPITSGPTEEEGLAIAADGRSLITSVGLRQRAVWLHDASGDERQISLEGYAYWPLLSADGAKVCYRITRGVGSGTSPSELWLTDLKSGRSDRLLPGQLVTNYDLSRVDRIVAAVVESDGKSRLWLAWIDGREPPQRIPGAEGDTPRFVSNDEIAFRAFEGGAWYIVRIHTDGSGRRALDKTSDTAWGQVSPDGRWINTSGSGLGLSLHSLVGEPPIRLLSSSQSTRLRWSPDSKHLSLSFQFGEASAFAVGRTYIVPLTAGSSLPVVPPGGFRSESEIAALPGVKVVQIGDFAPGPTPDVYAFSRTTGTRNLYQIPLP